uniref:Uncharacterized protein n=1 Tax=Arundo donax TaxID=35708 RepID=A0A0A9CT52_ARUDO
MIGNHQNQVLHLQLSLLLAKHVYACFSLIFLTIAVLIFFCPSSSLTRNRFAYDIVHIF